MIYDYPGPPIYEYWYEFVKDNPKATHEDWENYKKTHWEEREWVRWFDEFYEDVTGNQFG